MAIAGTDLLVLATQLLNEVKRAEILKDEKLEAFLSLTRTHNDLVRNDWDKRDRQMRRKDSAGEVICVYRENPSKGKPVSERLPWFY